MSPFSSGFGSAITAGPSTMFHENLLKLLVSETWEIANDGHVIPTETELLRPQLAMPPILGLSVRNGRCLGASLEWAGRQASLLSRRTLRTEKMGRYHRLSHEPG